MFCISLKSLNIFSIPTSLFAAARYVVFESFPSRFNNLNYFISISHNVSILTQSIVRILFLSIVNRVFRAPLEFFFDRLFIQYLAHYQNYFSSIVNLVSRAPLEFFFHQQLIQYLAHHQNSFLIDCYTGTLRTIKIFFDGLLSLV